MARQLDQRYAQMTYVIADLKEEYRKSRFEPKQRLS